MHPSLQTNEYWSDVIISAASTGEMFDNVNIVTLRSHLTEMVYALAYQMLDKVDVTYTMEDVHVKAKAVMHDITIQGSPYVEIQSDGITVVLDVPTITDDSTFDAMRALSVAVGKLNGKMGRVDVGIARRMVPEDLVNFG